MFITRQFKTAADSVSNGVLLPFACVPRKYEVGERLASFFCMWGDGVLLRPYRTLTTGVCVMLPASKG